jgi:hypothetical protein
MTNMMLMRDARCSACPPRFAPAAPSLLLLLLPSPLSSTLRQKFYLNIDATRTYNIVSLPESLSIDRLVSGELDYALLNTAALTSSDADLMAIGGVQAFPAFVVGVAPIFCLPFASQSLYANALASEALGLPALYPLLLNLEVMTQLFIGVITSWLDPQLQLLNPQLAPWFAATSASTNITLIVGATSALDPLKGAKLLFQTMRASRTSKLPSSRWAFPTAGWTTTDSSGAVTTVNPFTAVAKAAARAGWASSVYMTDVESRLTLKASITSGSISYRMLGTGASTTSTTGKTDPTVEWQMVQLNSAGMSEIVAPTTGALRQCSVAHLTVAGVPNVSPMTSAANSATLDGMSAGAITNAIERMLLLSTQQSWIAPLAPQPGCWPVSTLLSFIVPLTFTSFTSSSTSSSTSALTSGSCSAGLRALEFIYYMQSTPILTAPAEAFGFVRLAESSLVHRASEGVLISAMCDDVPLLVISPVLYTVPTSISAFGVVAATIGLIGLLVSAGVVVKFRNQVVIRSSTAPFLLLILLGLGMLIASVLAWSTTVPSDASCASFSWLSNLGFTLLFVPLFLKTWRVWRIFSGTHLKVVKLPNTTLMLMASAAIVGDFLLLAIWQGVSPMQPIQYTKLIDSRIHYYTHCSVTPSGMPFVIFEAIYKTLMLLGAAIMAFSTRNVKGTFNEASQIAWTIYNTILAGLITIVIIVFIAAIQTTLIVLVQIFLLWLSFIAWGLLFLPKFHLLSLSDEKTIEATRSALPQEMSNGFSFASAASMPPALLRQYYYALKMQVNKTEQQLGISITKFASVLPSANDSGSEGSSVRKAVSTMSPPAGSTRFAPMSGPRSSVSRIGEPMGIGESINGRPRIIPPPASVTTGGEPYVQIHRRTDSLPGSTNARGGSPTRNMRASFNNGAATDRGEQGILFMTVPPADRSRRASPTPPPRAARVSVHGGSFGGGTITTAPVIISGGAEFGQTPIQVSLDSPMLSYDAAVTLPSLMPTASLGGGIMGGLSAPLLPHASLVASAGPDAVDDLMPLGIPHRRSFSPHDFDVASLHLMPPPSSEHVERSASPDSSMKLLGFRPSSRVPMASQ